MSTTLMAARVTPPARPFEMTPACVTAVLLAAIVAVGWVGFLQSDDVFYADAARAWAAHPPALGANHWGLRHAIVLPMALLFAVFGENEATLETPILLYAAALATLNYLCLRRVAGWPAAMVGTVAAMTTPLLAGGASQVFTDIPEACFITASLWAFVFARHGQRPMLLLLSGLAAGATFLTRETALVLPLFYGVLFLLGVGGRRLPYLWIAAGFVLVVGADTLFLAVTSGDPLYRLHVSARGVAGDNPSMHFDTAPGLDRFGALAAPGWIKPIVVLLANQEFGLFFWLAIPAAIYLAARETDPERRAVTRIMAGFALTWLVVVGYALQGTLWVQARYFAVLVPTLAVPLGVAFGRLTGRARPLGLIALAGLLMVEAGLIVARDNDPLFGERALARAAATADTPILTDSGTLAGADWLLRVAHARDRVEAGDPRPGELYFLNGHVHRSGQAPPATPRLDWTVVEQVQAPPRGVIRIAHALGLDRLLPGPIARRLDPPPRTATLYRVP